MKKNEKVQIITDEEAMNLLDFGLSLAYIGKTFKISEDALSIRIKSKGYKVINKQNERGTNNSLFKKIDNEEKAYWLGFLYADGHVHSTTNQISIGLAIVDYIHLEKFKKFIGAENVIMIDKKTNSCRYQFHSKEMKKDLIKLGCVPKKSLVLNFPKEDLIPKALMRHFIRGYFDGDGCLSYQRKSKINDLIVPTISIIGTENMLKRIISFLGIHSGKIRLANKKGNELVKEFGYYGENAIFFLKELYEDSNIYLDRKKKRYEVFKNANFAVHRGNFMNYEESKTGKAFSTIVDANPVLNDEIKKTSSV